MKSSFFFQKFENNISIQKIIYHLLLIIIVFFKSGQFCFLEKNVIKEESKNKKES